MITTPRLAIAGTHSGVGKTTVATALMAAFTRRGLTVQPFKVGPDFIDPGFHEAACGRASRNLDGWMLRRETNLQVFARACAGADIAVVEGVMGLFDGRNGGTDEGSTAQMAKWLGAPVVLVVDASAMARSAAALVHGFERFDPAVDVAGVLFNRAGGSGHAAMLRDACAGTCAAQPLGALPANENIAVPSRHLGLTLAREALTAACLEEMAAWIEAHTDLDALLRMARERSRPVAVSPAPATHPQSHARIAVARDAAFCFCYQDNLDLLAACGAELVEFSPIADRHLPPEIGGIYLGGGYPELHAAKLAANRPMLEAIRGFAAGGGPIYAECGGFMYLTDAIVDLEGRAHAMAGIFPTCARMQPRLAALGYVETEAGLRGHEFRYSEIDPMPPSVERCGAHGYRVNGVTGSYVHLHFLSRPEFAGSFVARCAGVTA
jgi:cobyrinic acid a,c-diamide synthase